MVPGKKKNTPMKNKPKKDNSSHDKSLNQNKTTSAMMPSGKDSLIEKKSYQNNKSPKNSHNSNSNVGENTKHNSEDMFADKTNIPSEDMFVLKEASKNKNHNSEDMFADEESTEESVRSALHLSPSAFVESPQGLRLSFKKLSMEVTPSLALENDSDESEEEEKSEKAEEVKETPSNSIMQSSVSEPLISSTVKSMSLEQIQEHITCCLQLNTENKINAKNAFALKLIDCMTIMIKNQDESNFAAMACQLDAGTKIYSQRVDAVHQQVMKLAESCAYAERKETKKKEQKSDEEEEDDANLNENERRRLRKIKKKILVPPEQLRRKFKGKDPRDNFVKLEAKPGSIFNKARRHPKDLSLTLEKNIPFWPDPDAPPNRVGGTVPLPRIPKLEKVMAKWRLSRKKTKESNPLPSSPSADNDNKESSVIDYENPRPSTSAEDDYDHFEDAPACADETTSELQEEVTEKVANAAENKELNIILLAESKMMNEMNTKPSRFDVLKALFYTEGENEYEYLKMDNVSRWMGETHWKRPQGANAAAYKKRASRKKKEFVEIKYDKKALQERQKASLSSVSSRRTIQLSRRALTNWKNKKLTYPPDIHFDSDMLYKLFNIDAKALFSDKEGNMDSAIDRENDVLNLECDGERDDFEDDRRNSLNDNNATPRESELDQLHSDSEPAENCVSEDYSPQGSPAQLDTEEAQEKNEKQAAEAVSKPSTSDGVYEGDNLVPMVKIVQVEPIRCVAKPNRVDFHHLKEVMLEVIQEKMNDKENRDPRIQEIINSSSGAVYFKDVLYELFNSDRLHRPTQEDLSVAMAFLCLLTLTNENNFSLNQEGNTGTEDIIISYAPPV